MFEGLVSKKKRETQTSGNTQQVTAQITAAATVVKAGGVFIALSASGAVAVGTSNKTN
jgi:hypothetical protein